MQSRFWQQVDRRPARLMLQAPLARGTISRSPSPDGLVPDDRERRHSGHVTETNLSIGYAAGRAGRYAEKVPLNSRQEDFVGWRWPIKPNPLPCPMPTKSTARPVSRGYFIRRPMGSCFFCEPRGKSHPQTLPARTLSYKDVRRDCNRAANWRRKLG